MGVFSLKIHYKSLIVFYLKIYLVWLLSGRRTFLYIQRMKIDNNSFKDIDYLKITIS